MENSGFPCEPADLVDDTDECEAGGEGGKQGEERGNGISKLPVRARFRLMEERANEVVSESQEECRCDHELQDCRKMHASFRGGAVQIKAPAEECVDRQVGGNEEEAEQHDQYADDPHYHGRHLYCDYYRCQWVYGH